MTPLLIDGQEYVFDYDNYTVAVDGVSRPVNDQERAMVDATKIGKAQLAELMVQREAEADAQAEREAVLAQPLTPLPISGTTVAAVKASADASVKDLASQMQAKIDAILGGS